MFEAEFEFMYFGRHPSYEVGPDYPVSSTGGTPVYEMTLAPEEYGYRYYDAPGISAEGAAESAYEFGFTTSGRYTPPAYEAGGAGSFMVSATTDTIDMSGKAMMKKLSAAINGLPRTSPAGFLDINTPFLSRYQQRYFSAPTNNARNVTRGSLSLNFQFGGDADDDETTFEEYVQSAYNTAPYSTHIRRAIIYANRNASGYRRPTSPGATPGIDSFFVDTGGTTGLSYGIWDLNPVVEVMWTDLITYMEPTDWYQSTSDYTMFSELVGGSMLIYDLETGTYTARMAIPKDKPVTTGGAFSEDNESYIVSYSYEITGDNPRYILDDIQQRFKTKDYVLQFSSTLIDDRLDKIANLVGTSIDRESDIKMQKNQPLNYGNVTAMGTVELSIQDAPSPGTGAESSPSAGPGTPGGGPITAGSMEPTGGTGAMPESITDIDTSIY